MLQMNSNFLFQRIVYTPPPFVVGNVDPQVIPRQKVTLGRFPTPLHRLQGLAEFDDVEMWVKRDDLSSFDLSGNKLRKLEHLLAEATEEDEDGRRKYDSIITIGGVQSNHCRSTACAARQLNLAPHLILRTPHPAESITLEGNLLLARMVGSQIYTVTPSVYAQIGSTNLVHQLEKQLIGKGLKPYVIPVGGSNVRGAFGYLDFIHELMEQTKAFLNHGEGGGESETAEGAEGAEGGGYFDHIIFACGSGGTATGIALGAKLANLKAKITAIGVCDSPEYFYNHIESSAMGLGLDMAKLGPPKSWLTVYPGQGIGYARSTEEELAFLQRVGYSTGIVFDPVYSGKALYYLATRLMKGEDSIVKKGDKCLFVHTGGILGLYDKASQLLPLLPADQVVKMDVTAPQR